MSPAHRGVGFQSDLDGRVKTVMEASNGFLANDIEWTRNGISCNGNAARQGLKEHEAKCVR